MREQAWRHPPATQHLRSLESALDTAAKMDNGGLGESGVLLVGARHRGPVRRPRGKGNFPTGPRFSTQALIGPLCSPTTALVGDQFLLLLSSNSFFAHAASDSDLLRRPSLLASAERMVSELRPTMRPS